MEVSLAKKLIVRTDRERERELGRKRERELSRKRERNHDGLGELLVWKLPENYFNI